MVDPGKEDRWTFKTLREMRSYTVIWSGQLVSLIGSGMTIFALLVWLYEETGQATSVSLLFLFAFGPSVALSPLAGVLVDRYSRKTIMLLSDGLAAVATSGLLVLHQMDMLNPWSVYGLMAIGGVFEAFQFPALSAATTLMVPKEHYGRASGMLSIAWTLSEMLSPILAAILLVSIGLTGVLLVDLATFVVAVLTLAAVPIPKPRPSKEGEESKTSWKDDLAFGWRYILARPGLLGLLVFFFVTNLVGTMGWVLFQPMVLAKTGNDEVLLGTVMLLGGLGGIIGGVVMSIWGGAKRRVRGIFWGILIGVGIGSFVTGVRGGFVVWAVGIFLWAVTDPIVMGASQSIWQSKVPPDLQGRVFSVRFFIALVGSLPAMLVAGPLADYVFEPLMMDATGPLTWLVGSGPGAGMGLFILITGLVMVVASLLIRSSKALWNVEDDLPDFDDEDEGEDEDEDEGEEEEEDRRDEGNGPSEEAPEEGARDADEAGGPPEEGPDQPGGELDLALVDDEVQ